MVSYRSLFYENCLFSRGGNLTDFWGKELGSTDSIMSISIADCYIFYSGWNSSTSYSIFIYFMSSPKLFHLGLFTFKKLSLISSLCYTITPNWFLSELRMDTESIEVKFKLLFLGSTFISNISGLFEANRSFDFEELLSEFEDSPAGFWIFIWGTWFWVLMEIDSNISSFPLGDTGLL